MKSSNPRQTIIDLLSEVPADPTSVQKSRLLKLCGFTRANDVETALQNGINLIGLIFASKSPRAVNDEQALAITQLVQKYGERTGAASVLVTEVDKLIGDKLSPKLWFQRCADVLRKVTVRQPLTVGVFQDQPLEYVSRTFTTYLYE